MTKTSSIIIGSDHGGFELKQICIAFLTDKGFQVTDQGCFSTAAEDYPLIAQSLSRRILSGEFSRGILLCGTGIGMSMAANRLVGIRATLCTDHFSARMAREHNDSNILVLGGRVLGIETAKDILDTWLTTAFSGGRHQKRLDLLDRTAP